MIVPAATDHLVTKRLPHMLALTAAIAVVGALAGFGAAYALDAATSGAMAFVFGLVFVVVLVGSRTVARLQAGSTLAVHSSLALWRRRGEADERAASGRGPVEKGRRRCRAVRCRRA